MVFIEASLKSFVLTLPGCLIPGIVIFFTLTYLLVPFKIMIPTAIMFSVLVFGLTKYYAVNNRVNSTNNSNSDLRRSAENTDKIPQGSFSIFPVFLSVYTIFLLIAAFISTPNSELFIPWNEITQSQIIQLTAATALSFFLPGYALVTMIDKKQELRPLPKVLLGYIFSMLITGLTGYIMASAGYAVSDVKMLIIGIYAVVLATSILLYLRNKKILLSSSFKHGGTSGHILTFGSYFRQHFFISWNRSLHRITANSSSFIVFLSLFGLVVVYTYQLYDGKIVGDQWFHLGRSMMFTSGSYGNVIDYDSDTIYPPFFSALLSVFSTLAGIPSVNAYASIHFLNIIPVFAFYYFFIKWAPARWKKAALLASVLFVVSSGFGWIYVLDRAIEQDTMMSPELSLRSLHYGGLKTSDVRSPTTFVNVGHPDFSTPLLIAALPAGFTMMGLSKHKSFNNIYMYIAIVTGISYFGIAFHDEFYFFIIVTSILPLAFRLKQKNILYAALVSSVSLIVLTDILSPGKYFTVREILGFPLLALVFLFALLTWLIYYTQVASKKLSLHKKGLAWIVRKLKSKIRHYSHHSNIRFYSGVLIISAIVYLYLFTFLVWGELSERDVRIQTRDFGQSDVPWYLYPMKFGLTGLLGLASILSYIFKRYEKEVFVFGIIALVAFLAGPFYQEHRFGKYIMSAMAGFASILIYRIIIALSNYYLTPLIYGLFTGSIIIVSSLSVVFFLSYNVLGLENSHLEMSLSKRDFPSSTELQMLDFLRTDQNAGPASYSVAIPSDEYDLQRGFIPKLESFSALPRVKLLEAHLTLNASTLGEFYDLIEQNDIHYIILPKKDYLDGEGDSNLQYPLRFVLDNFQRAYEDENYIVLTVPSNLTPPSQGEVTGADIALVYQPHDRILSLPQQSLMSSSLSGQIVTNVTNILSYSNESFKGLGRESEFVKTVAVYDDYKNINNVQNGSNGGNSGNSDGIVNNNSSNNATVNPSNFTKLILYGDKREKGGITLWSNPLVFDGEKIQIQPLEQPEEQKVAEEIDNRTTDTNNNNGTTASAINYIQARFRVIDDYNNTKKNHDAGIKWTDERKNEYYAALRNNGLELELVAKQGSDNSSREEENNNKNSNSSKSNNVNGNYSSDNRYYFQNREIKFEKGIWYTLEVVVAQNTINVYVDNKLAIKAPRVFSDQFVLAESKGNNDNDNGNDVDFNGGDNRKSNASNGSDESVTNPPSSSSDSISKIGIRSFHNTAEFQPVIVGHISFPEIISDSANYQQEVYHHYYPLSLLALSNMKYEAFVYGDYSALSKKYVILPFDPLLSSSPLASSSSSSLSSSFPSPRSSSSSSNSSSSSLLPSFYSNNYYYHYSENQNYTINKYLDYAKSGGNLIIISSDRNFNSSIKPPNTVGFDISNSTNKSQNNNQGSITAPAPVTHATNIDAGESTPIAVIEKKYGEGKIIFVNADGYFDLLFDKINSINETGKDSINNKDLSKPSARFIGDLKISSADDILIKSSSLLLPERITDSFDIHVGDINYKTSDQDQRQKQNQKQEGQEEQCYPNSKDVNFKNVLLKHLKLHGKYQVTVSSTTAGRLNLPSFPSYYDYFAIPVQGGFDIKIKKLSDSFDEDDEDTKIKTGKNNITPTSAIIINSTGYTSSSSATVAPPNVTSPAADITVIDNAEDDSRNNDGNNKTIGNGYSIVNSTTYGNNIQQQSIKIRLTDNNDEIVFCNIKAKARSLIEEKDLLSASHTPSSTQDNTNSENKSNDGDDANIAIPLIIKSPEITIINGTARFDKLRDPDRLWETLSFPTVEVSGQNIGLKLNYVDYNHEPYRKVGTRTGYITFFNWIDDRVDNPDNVKFTYEGVNQAQGIQIPADISERAKSQGIGVPWETVITSLNNLVLIIAVVGATLLTIAIHHISKREALRAEK